MKRTLRSLRPALALSALIVAGRLAANPFVVFGKQEFYDLGAPASLGPTEPGKKAFFEAYKSDRSAHPTYETELDLINPPSWGKTVSAQTHGSIQIHPSFAGGLACRLTLDGLLPDHD